MIKMILPLIVFILFNSITVSSFAEYRCGFENNGEEGFAVFFLDGGIEKYRREGLNEFGAAAAFSACENSVFHSKRLVGIDIVTLDSFYRAGLSHAMVPRKVILDPGIYSCQYSKISGFLGIFQVVRNNEVFFSSLENSRGGFQQVRLCESLIQEGQVNQVGMVLYTKMDGWRVISEDYFEPNTDNLTKDFVH